MKIHDKDDFAKAWEQLDTPEDIEQEILHSKSGKTYAVVDGELKQVEGA